MFCQYKEIFGKPNEEVHAYRIPYVDLAAVDVVATFIFGVIFWYVTRYCFAYIIVVLLLIGIIAHRLFCVRTKIDRCLFSD